MRNIHSGARSTLKEIAYKSMTGNSALLDIANLEEHEDNEYLFGMEGIGRLADEIKRVGFKGAIEVWDLGGGKYKIYSGARRTKAVEMNGDTTIPAFVYPYPERESERRRVFLGANIYGRNAVRADDPIHTARQMAYLRDTIRMEKADGTYEGDRTREQIAAEFGTSPSSVYKYLSLLSLNDRAQKAVTDGSIQFGQASSMAVLDEARQNVVLDSIDLLKTMGLMDTRDDVQLIVDYVKEHSDCVTPLEVVNGITAAAAGANPSGTGNGEAAKAGGALEGGAEEDPAAKRGLESGAGTAHKAFTGKAAVRKLSQCLDRFGAYVATEKEYRDEDKADVVEKLERIKAMCDEELARIAASGAEKR